jgi:hypothetical protein
MESPVPNEDQAAACAIAWSSFGTGRAMERVIGSFALSAPAPGDEAARNSLKDGAGMSHPQVG